MRLQGCIKLGFFPASPGAIRALLRHLEAAPGTTALDPCCGAGAALGQSIRGLGIPEACAYAIELDEGRSDRARAALPGSTVLGPASFLATRITYGCFGLAYVNPPFDSAEAGSGERVEEQFLYRATHLLAPGGVLALVLPERTFTGRRDLRAHLDANYDRAEAFRFPEADRPYKELCVLGVRRARPALIRRGEGRWHDWDYWRSGAVESLPELGSTSDRYRIPAGTPPKLFEAIDYTEATLVAAIDRSPLNRLLDPPRPRPLPSPPLALGAGHIGLLLVSGHINGLVCPPGGERHVVRGGTRKEKYLKESETSEDSDGKAVTKEVWAERPVPLVRVMDDTGEIRTLEG